MKPLVSIGLPLALALAVFWGTRPDKPVYALAGKTVMTVTDKGGPAILHAPDPIYAGAAEGTVKLRVHIAANGTVGHVEVASGPEELRKPAMDAVKQWQYEAKELDTEVLVPFSAHYVTRSYTPPRPVRPIPHGGVRVVALVRPDGTVEHVMPASGRKATATEMIKEWKFTPAQRNGAATYGSIVLDVP